MSTPLNSPYPTPPDRAPGRPPATPAPPVASPVPAWAQPPVRRGFGHVPLALWIGLGVAGLAFFLRFSYQQVSAGSEGYSCSYTNFAGFLAAAGVVACVITGWATRAATHPNRRLALPVMSAFTLLLVVLAGVHVLRGTGAIFNPCDAHPMP